MADLFSDYEKQFGTLSADITAKIGRIPNLSGGERKGGITDVEQKLDEAQELLEQMDLEARSMPQEYKSKYGSKLKSYKDELDRLEQELRKAKVSLSDTETARAELLAGDDVGHSEDQRARLLDNTERLERSSKRLEEGYRVCIETEQIGTEILDNLERDRETITRTRDRLRGTNTNLTKSSRILTGMMRRIIQNRILLGFICLIILCVIGVVIYFSVKH